MAVSDNTNFEILLPSGIRSTDFKTSAYMYLSDHFHKWLMDEVCCYMLPGIFQPTFRESVDPNASGRKEMTKPLNKRAAEDIIGQEAEYQIYQMLQKFSTEHSYPIFVIHGFKFTKMLGRFLKLMYHGLDEKFSQEEFENDFIIFDKSGNVIVMEVKGGNNLNKLKEARKQSGKGIFLLHTLKNTFLQDDQTPEISFKQFHVFPNVTDTEVPKDTLVADQLASFPKWWFDNISASGQRTNNNWQLLALLVSLHTVAITEVTGNLNVQLKVDKNAESILKLRDMEIRSHKIQIQIKDIKTSLLVTERKSIFRTNKSLQVFNLTPEQKLLFTSSKLHTIVEGISGSGKTLLIQMKCLEICLGKKEKVTIVCNSSMNAHFEKVFRDNNCMEYVTILTHSEMAHLQSIHEHLFCDDLHTNFYLLNNLERALNSSIGFGEFQIWLVFDYRQCGVTLDFKDRDSIEKQLQIYEKLGFHRFWLTTTLRNSREIWEVFTGILSTGSTMTLEDSLLSSPSFRLKEETREETNIFLGHNLPGSNCEACLVDLKRTNCSGIEIFDAYCFLTRKALDILFEELKYCPEDVSILFNSSLTFEMMEIERAEHKICPQSISLSSLGEASVLSEMQTATSVEYGMSDHAVSREWPVVIVWLPTIEGMENMQKLYSDNLQLLVGGTLYVSISRARTKLILIGPKESLDLLKNRYNGLENIVERLFDLTE